MKVRIEIAKYSKDTDKDVLNWLFDKYHWQSEWYFVAKCELVGRYPNSHRVWYPTKEGVVLFNHRAELESED